MTATLVPNESIYMYSETLKGPQKISLLTSDRNAHIKIDWFIKINVLEASRYTI